MKTLRPGESATEGLKSGTILLVSAEVGSAIVEIIQDGKKTGSVNVSSSDTFGPYDYDVVIRIDSIDAEVMYVQKKHAQFASGSLSNPVYNPDGTMASAVIDGYKFIFTWNNGKIAQVSGAGMTKSYTWTEGKLTNVSVN